MCDNFVVVEPDAAQMQVIWSMVFYVLACSLLRRAAAGEAGWWRAALCRRRAKVTPTRREAGVPRVTLATSFTSFAFGFTRKPPLWPLPRYSPCLAGLWAVSEEGRSVPSVTCVASKLHCFGSLSTTFSVLEASHLTSSGCVLSAYTSSLFLDTFREVWLSRAPPHRPHKVPQTGVVVVVV